MTDLPDKIDVLDHGFVRLDGYMADDLAVVNGARVSFAKHKEIVDQSDAGLIRFLMREGHGSPFEHTAFRFHVRAPLFVAREWFRHRIGSFNEFSMRYSEATPDFYYPAQEDVRSQVGKPGAYTFEPIEQLGVIQELGIDLKELYEMSYSTYKTLLALGIAKELARIVIPMGAYTEFYWTVNARALMNFLMLRGGRDAQLEIRKYAEVVEKFYMAKMPLCYESFVVLGRKAP